jgi:hypothetical protein
MMFELYTGEQCEDNEYDCSMRGLWLRAINEGHHVWMPRYDWCGRYIGAIIDGVYHDVSNIRKRHMKGTLI